MTKFTYNPRTCRYERQGFSLWRATGLFVLILTISSLFFAGIAALHAITWDSKEEVTLREENRALERNYSLVKQQYIESENQLGSLDEKDKALKASLFNSIFSETTPERQTESYIVIPDISRLRRSIHNLTNRTSQLKKDAVFNSHYFSEHITGERNEILDKLTTTPSILPVPSAKLISGFGKRIHPFHKGLYDHPGIDLAATRGTEVIAAADGIISTMDHSDLLAGYGNYVEVDHGKKVTTRYAHLETIAVRSGQKIKKGQVLGTVGSSGGSIAPHLHYEVLLNGKEQNPMFYLLQDIDAKTYEQLLTISKKQNQSLD